ncbi:MAG: helix-turn-helix transcriptional regulator [Pseudomonadota bacterium]
MSIDVLALQSVSDDLLQTALVPGGWGDAVERIRAATGSHGVNFMPIVGKAPFLPHTEGMARGFEEYFKEGWAERDYRLRSVPLAKKQRIIIDRDFMTPDEYGNEYFRFLGQFKLKYMCNVIFEIGTEMVSCSLHRSSEQGDFSPDEASVLVGLSQRLSISGLIARSIAEVRVSGLAEAFQLMKVPTLFLDRSGRVASMNGAAEAIMGDGINVSGGDLKARERSETKKLQALAYAVTRMPALPCASHVVRVTRVGKRPLVIRFQPIQGLARDLFSDVRAMAIVDDLENRPQADASALQMVYGLTRTEAAIATLLAQGAGAREIAQTRAISYETARTHIKSVLQKMDASRHSEVAAILAALR